MRPTQILPAIAAPAHPAQAMVGCVPLMRSGGLRWGMTIGADVRAHYEQQRGAACQGCPSGTLHVLSESVVVHGPFDHGDDATCHNSNAAPHK